MEFRTYTFTVPSGYIYTIREQNGADEEILSNPMDLGNLMNLTKFIAAIVVETNFTVSKRLTIDDALNIPVNDRYCIILNSRIFSMGEEVEFTYDWGKDGGKLLYAQDLNEFLFDYSKAPTAEDLEKKPEAIPYYPMGKKLYDLEIVLSSGKKLKFDIMNGSGEQKLVTMPKEKQTRNAPLLCRNLQLEVDGKWETVENFSLFSVKDMQEIRKGILEVDPTFQGNSEVTSPTGEVAYFPILASPNFFYLTED